MRNVEVEELQKKITTKYWSNYQNWVLYIAWLQAADYTWQCNTVNQYLYSSLQPWSTSCSLAQCWVQRMLAWYRDSAPHCCRLSICTHAYLCDTDSSSMQRAHEYRQVREKSINMTVVISRCIYPIQGQCTHEFSALSKQSLAKVRSTWYSLNASSAVRRLMHTNCVCLRQVVLFISRPSKKFQLDFIICSLIASVSKPWLILAARIHNSHRCAAFRDKERFLDDTSSLNTDWYKNPRPQFFKFTSVSSNIPEVDQVGVGRCSSDR